MKQYSNKLYNATPFPVNIKWDKGVYISIEPFDYASLTIAQVEDFKGDTPGYETIQILTDSYGIFLYDPNQTYNVQALEAVKRCIQSLEDQYNAAYTRAKDMRAATGYAPDEGALLTHLNQMGYGKLKERIDILKNQASKLEEAVQSEPSQVTVNQLDPERTVFELDPPREFPSKAQMEIFLDLPGNEEIKARHLKWKKQYDKEQVNAEGD